MGGDGPRRARRCPTRRSPRIGAPFRAARLRRRRRPTTTRFERAPARPSRPSPAGSTQQRRAAQGRRLRHRHDLAEAARRARPATARAEQMELRRRSRRRATARARSASRTSRTWCCRMSAATICRRSGDALDAAGLATANVGLVSDIIACPGLDYCSLANARSIPIAQQHRRAASPTRARARDRRAADQDLRLHQRLRPSPCRPYRHPGRRQERRGVLPDHARRQRRRERGARAPSSAPRCRATRSTDAVDTLVEVYLRLRSDGRALPRHLSPRRRRAVQGGALCRSLRTGASSPIRGAISPTTRRCPTAARVTVSYARWSSRARDAARTRRRALGRAPAQRRRADDARAPISRGSRSSC